MSNLTVRGKDIRAVLKNTLSGKEPCFICGEHENISEKHHLIALEECAFWMNFMYFSPDMKIGSPTVWLCPNHHRHLHLITKTLEFPDCFTPSHVEKYQDLLTRRTVGLEELRKQIQAG